MLVLSTRTVLLMLFQIVSRIVLAKNLVSEDFGSFGIIMGWIGTLMFFTDIGLGDVLVRKAEGVADKDFAGYFFIRLFLSLVIVTMFLAAYPFLRGHYGLNFTGAEFGGLVSLFIVMDVLSACPMLLMGHKLEFLKIAKIELTGAVLTYIVQIALSFYLKGPWAFFFGLFAGKLALVLMSFSLVGKLPFPKFNKELLHLHLNKGLLFQIATILPSLQAIIAPFIMSYFLKIDSIGIIFWIEGLVSIPLNIIFNYNRVAFVSLSKFAGEPEKMKDVIKSFMLPMFSGICLVFGLGAVLSKFIILQIFGVKWIEATYTIHLSCVSLGIYSLRFLGLSVLSAANQPLKRVLNEASMIALAAVLMVLVIPHYGVAGYFYAMIAANFISLLVMLYSLREFLHKAVYRRLLAALCPMILAIVFHFKSGLQETNLVYAAIVYLVIFSFASVVLDSSITADARRLYLKIKEQFLIRVLGR